MQDVFYEESTTLNNEKSENKKYGLIKFAAMITIFIAVFWAYLVIFFLDLRSIFNILFFGVLPIVIFIFLGLYLGKIKDKFSVVYDYTFITGSVRISKVIRGVKRKSVINFECSEIEKMGKIDTDSYNSYLSQVNNGLDFIRATINVEPSYNKAFYYVVVNAMSKKTLIVLECSKEFIVNVLKFSKRSIVDGELLKWYI